MLYSYILCVVLVSYSHTHIQVYNGKSEVVDILILAGASVDVKNKMS